MALVAFRRLDAQVSPFMMQEQSLVASKREAQWNFEKSQHYLDTGFNLEQSSNTDRKPNKSWRGVLLADLNKAFERVDVGWIMKVLAALRVPVWIFNFVAFLSSARISQFRIGRTLGGTIKMARALDMGNSMSPWIFCLCLDPLFRELRKQGGEARLINGYVDDTSTGDDAIVKVGGAQETISAFSRVSGLIVILHSCSELTVMSPIGDANGPLQPTETFAGPSWHRVAKKALAGAHPGSIFKYRDEAIDRMLIEQWAAQGASRNELPKSWQCGCATKMALVPVRQPTDDEWRLLDLQPWGASITAEVAVHLGMPLSSSEAWDKTPVAGRKAQSALAFAKPVTKILHRTRLFELTRRSSISGCAYWTSYVSSCPSYIGSYFLPPPELVLKMNKVRARVTGTVHWLDEAIAPAVFDLLHISSMADFEMDMKCHLIGAAIRLHGADLLSNGADQSRRVKAAVSTLGRELAALSQVGKDAWRRIITGANLLPARQLASKCTRVLKNDFSLRRKENAVLFLQNISSQRRDLPTDGEEWVTLSNTPTQAAGHLARVAALRWFAGRDFDQTKLRPTGGKIVKCGICSSASEHVVWPLGRNYSACCTTHFDTSAPTSHVVWASLVPESAQAARLQGLAAPWGNGYRQVSAAVISWAGVNWHATDTPPIKELQVKPEDLDWCPLCGLPGDTVEHYRWWCPVSNWAIRLFKEAESPDLWLNPNAANGRALLYVIIHQTRLMVMAQRAVARPRPSFSGWVARLKLLTLEIRLSMSPLCIPVPEPPRWSLYTADRGSNKRKFRDESGCEACMQFASSPGLTTTAPRRKTLPDGHLIQSNRRKGVSVFSTDTPPETIVATIPADAWENGTWVGQGGCRNVPPGRLALPGAANLVWKPLACPCGAQWVILITSKKVYQGDSASVAMAAGLQIRGGRICLQADGSVKNPGTPFAAAGAGVVAWHVGPDGTDTRLFDIVHPLLGDTTSMQAEAAASILAIDAISSARAACRKAGLVWTGAPLIQADNNIIARHWTGDARIRQALVARRIEDAWTASIFTGSAPIWEAIPRELNSPADKAAGDASAMALEAITQRDTAIATPTTRGPRLGSGRQSLKGLAGAVRQTSEVNAIIAEFQLGIGAPADALGMIAHALAIEAGVNQVGAIALIECPLLTNEAWAIARQLAPTRTDVLNYLRAITGFAADGRSGVLALYECKAPNGQGRAYPVDSAARFPKLTQVALFGTHHTEFDIIGCHLALFLEVAREQGLCLQWRSVTEVRQWIASATNVPGAGAKHLCRLLITAPEATIVREATLAGGTWTEAASAGLASFISARPTVLAALRQRGLVGNEPRVVSNNALYYALEAAEGLVMRTWVNKIMARAGMVSCILRGDGIWLDANVEHNLVLGAFDEAALQCGFPTLDARASHLGELVKALPAPGLAQLGGNADAGVRAPLAARGLAPRLGGAPRQPFLDFLDHVRHPDPPRWIVPPKQQ